MMLEQVLDPCESLTALAGAMFGDAGEAPEAADRTAAPAPEGASEKDLPAAA